MLAVVAITAVIAGRLEVIIPIFAKKELRGGAQLFSTMSVARGIGSLISSLYLAGRAGRPTLAAARRSAIVLAGALAVMAVPVSGITLRRGIVLAMLVVAGASTMFTVVTSLSLTQLEVDAPFRGRTVAIWFVASNLGTVIGSPLAGWISESVGTSYALSLGAMSMLSVVGLLTSSLRSTAPGLEHISEVDDVVR